MTRTKTEVPVPERMQSLPRNKAGYVVPWFVAMIDGEYDFRVIRVMGIEDALLFKKCWLCGQHLGKYGTFVIGPMCCINRTSAEPPSHKECAEYAAKMCPFLTVPKMVRRENRLPDDARNPAGEMLKRNPGVTLLWTSTDWEVYRAQAGQSGILFDIGEPTDVQWWSEGRFATRDEVQSSIDSGLPFLRQLCDEDPTDPAKAHEFLEEYIARAEPYLPVAS